MNKGPLRVLRIMGPVVSGGVDVITMNYYRQLDKQKIQLDFIFDGYHETNIDEEIKSLGGKIYKVEPYTSNIFKNMYQIYTIIKENEYEIVHSHMNSLSVFPLCAAKVAGAKIRIASNHSTSNKGEGKKSIMKELLRPFAKVFPTHYAACSKHAAEWLFGKKKLEDGSVTLIKNAINLEKYNYNPENRDCIRKQLNVEDNFVVGHVGRFAYQKNHKFLIEIFSEIIKKKPNAILLLIGDGPLKDELMNDVNRRGLNENVIFLGIRKDVHLLMQAMDVFVFPSFYEGLGNVITETQAVATMAIVSEAIPEEIKFTEYVETMSLSQSSLEWCDKILSFDREYVRRNTQIDLRNNGYDIKLAAKQLVSYYLDIYKTK